MVALKAEAKNYLYKRLTNLMLLPVLVASLNIFVNLRGRADSILAAITAAGLTVRSAH